MVKLTAEQQSMLVEAEPEIFRPVPGGWGKRGSTNVRLARADRATLLVGSPGTELEFAL